MAKTKVELSLSEFWNLGAISDPSPSIPTIANEYCQAQT